MRFPLILGLFLLLPRAAAANGDSGPSCEGSGKNIFCGDFSEGAFGRFEEEENAHLQKTQSQFASLSPRTEKIFKAQKNALKLNQTNRRELCQRIKALETGVEESLKQQPKDTKQCQAYADLKKILGDLYTKIYHENENIHTRWSELNDIDSQGLIDNKADVDSLFQSKQINEEQYHKFYKEQLWQVWQHGRGLLLCRFHSGMADEMHRLKDQQEKLVEQYKKMQTLEIGCKSDASPGARPVPASSAKKKR